MSKNDKTETAPSNTETPAAAPKRQKVDSTFSEGWKPENVGDTLEGRYLGFEEAPGRNGETFQAYQILTEKNGRVSCAGAYLDSLLPQVPKGAYVWITYTGEKTLKNKNTMAMFSLEVEQGVKLLDVLK